MELMYKRKALGLEGIPFGGIIAYSGEAETIPEGWAVCDGENGTPDLRGRFILGSSETHPMGETGGSETVALTETQLPSHYHSVANSPSGSYLTPNTGTLGCIPYKAGASAGSVTTPAGGNQPHPNMPPYYALIYIMKL